MLSYEQTIYNTLRSVTPIPLSDQPGTFAHGQPPNRRQYHLLSFGDASTLVSSEVRFDARSKQWTLPSQFGVLSYLRVGQLVTTAWRSAGIPNLSLFEASRWEYNKLTEYQRADDYLRFDTKTVPLSTTTSFIRYYDQHHYVQVRGYGFYHLHGDVAKLGVPVFPSNRLALTCGVVDAPRGDRRPYTFHVSVGLTSSALKSPFSLDQDISFLARG